MSTSIGVANGFTWLGSPGEDFFRREIATYFDNDENLTHISAGQVKSMLADYEAEGASPDDLARAQEFTRRLCELWEERGLGDDDALTVQLG